MRQILALATLLISLPLAAPHQQASRSEEIYVRNAHAMAYDSRRGRVVLFGGADEAKVCGDTWEWDGKTWTRVSDTGPGPRTFPAMVYDSVRQKVVLFGGNRVLFGKSPVENRFLNDTWEWDGQRWLQIQVEGPPPRAEAAIAFDARRGRVVLFGGHNHSREGRNRLGDTWEWDGSKWMQIKTTGPSPRNGAAQVYDSVRGKIVLFGGATEKGLSGETWEWDGKEWVENRAALTVGRFNCVMAYDVAQRKVIRFGGRYAGKPVGDTWEYDFNTWKQVVGSTGPEARNHAAMVYDEKRRKIVLFGGHDLGTHETTTIFGDTWEWGGNAWVLTQAGESRKRLDNGH